MIKSASPQQPHLSDKRSGATLPLAARYCRYLATVRKLLIAHQHTDGLEQNWIFTGMIHAFMRELCDYPPSTYVVTTSAFGDPDAVYYPHVVPVAPCANPTLFYFTPSDDMDDVQDLWVKHAQVYLVDPPPGDTAAAWAKQVVCSNFRLLDGAHKDGQNDAWQLWSVSDVEGTTTVRVDLRHLNHEPQSDVSTCRMIQARLQKLQYQIPPDIADSNANSRLLPRYRAVSGPDSQCILTHDVLRESP